MSEDLLLYAQLGYADHISRLVAEGTDPDWPREDGVTTLMIAALAGRLTIMEALINAGATVDLVLLKAGSDPTQKDERGLNASRYARELGEPPPELESLLAPVELGAAAG